MSSFAVSSSSAIFLRRWLSVCMILVVCMVALGGVTRLTESGLSIVKWKLVTGTLPPLSAQDWETEFSEYKESPQYLQTHSSNFSLNDFKDIFWLEYLHRLLGRIIGLVVVGGTFYHWLRKRMTPALFRRMLAVSLLVSAQGTVGWIMVASGLQNEPRVAPIKLGLHLLLAFGLFSALTWTRWQVAEHERQPAAPTLALLARGLMALLLIQILLGALVAGLRAGLSYNTYPLMDGQWVPQGLHLISPWWKNHLESVLTVQFQHRMSAVLVAVCIVAFIGYAWKKIRDPKLLVALGATLGVQFLLGVTTLLSGVNLWLASAHQLVALLLLFFMLRVLYLVPMRTQATHK